MINFKCNECSQPIEVSEEIAGKQGKCPHCESSVIVPAPVLVGVAEPVRPDGMHLSWVEGLMKVDHPVQPAGPKPLSFGDQVKSFIGTLLYWVFGLLFAGWTLTVLFQSLLAALPLLAATILLLPPICDRIMVKFRVDFTPQVRVIGAVVLGITGMLLLASHVRETENASVASATHNGLEVHSVLETIPPLQA